MPAKIIINSSPKLNLCLDVIKKDSSNYHEIRTIFCTIKEPKDELIIFETKQPDNTSIEIDLKSTYPEKTIKMEDNLAHKALLLIKKTYKIKKNASIKIKKRIPVSAGLGGASSNAAATLKGLNTLWNLNLSAEELRSLASELGADVPFFIKGKTALGTHFGEKITTLPDIGNIEFKLTDTASWPKAKSDQINMSKDWAASNQRASISKTAQMYASLDLKKCGKNTEKTAAVLEAIKNQKAKPKISAQTILENLHNDFEILYQISPSCEDHDNSANHIHLSGAGPATFIANLKLRPSL